MQLLYSNIEFYEINFYKIYILNDFHISNA